MAEKSKYRSIIPVKLVVFFVIFLFPYFPSTSMADVIFDVGDGAGYLGSINNSIVVSLENLDDKVKYIYIEICDADDYLNVNSITKCQTTTRSSTMECGAIENGGCAWVYLSPLDGGIIETGSGPVMTVSFDVSSGASVGECRAVAINPTNSFVKNDWGNNVSFTSSGGSFCFSSCSSDPDCSDGFYCSGSAVCGSGVCSYSGNPCTPETECNYCNEDTDSCFDPADTPCADDGLFCNGSEICDGAGTCAHSGDPCPGASVCDEEQDECMCEETNDCEDGLYCNGMDYCLIGVCQSVGDPCGSGLHCDEEASDCMCWYDIDCDDGFYCNGQESCSAGQCLSGTSPCSAPYACDEETDSCVLPDVTLDVDDGAGFIGWANVDLKINLSNTSDKIGGVQFEVCDEHDYLAVTGCEMSSRVPAGMACVYSPSLNGCDSILLYDPVLSGIYIPQGTGNILTMKYDVKGQCNKRGAECDCAAADCYELGDECSVGDPDCYLLVHNECTGGNCHSGCYQLNEPCMHADTGCMSVTPENIVVFDETQTELGVLGETGEFCIYCLNEADCNNNQCTDDTCGGDSLCVHVNNNSNSCEDGLYCTTNDFCSEGVCVSGSVTSCDPYNVCNEDNDTCVPCAADDWDCDGIADTADNCFVTGSSDADTPNGPGQGTCVKTISGVSFGSDAWCASDTDCAASEVCQKDQGDYNSNGIGDACECYANINGDDKVDLFDLLQMKNEYNTTGCTPETCPADIDGDTKVGVFDLLIIKAQYGMSHCPVMP